MENIEKNALEYFASLSREEKVAILRENALLTQEVTDELDCTSQSLWNEVRCGNIKAVKNLRHGRLFLKDDVAEFKDWKKDHMKRRM